MKIMVAAQSCHRAAAIYLTRQIKRLIGGTMQHSGTTSVLDPGREATTFNAQPGSANHTVLVVRDDGVNNYLVDAICEFLDISVEHVASGDDLAPILRVTRPIAVVTDLDGEVQDGYHVMKMTAAYDQDLPVLLLTVNHPVLLGAVDGVREVWGLTHVATATGASGVGLLVDFLCHAARSAGISRLLRV